MRLPTALLALLAACLVSLVVAIPSPFVDQQPLLGTPTPQRSLWRKLSDRVIDSVFGDPYRSKAAEKGSTSDKNGYAPSHTLARYGGDVVLRFNVSTNEEAKALSEAADTLLLDIWEFSQYWVDIRLSQDIVAPLLGLLPDSLQHTHTPLLLERDLAQAIYDTYPAPRGPKPTTPHPTPPSHLRDRPFSPSLQVRDSKTNLFFSDYQPLSVIDPWLRLLASLFTTHVRVITLGLSAQGREIRGLRVGVHPTNSDEPNQPKRKTVLITGGLHAREWISTSTVNYAAYSLITGYGKIPSITRLLETFDFVFIPTLNPDGYVHTWTTDRLWRKNRQQTGLRFCQGIDLDRSFGFQWDGDVTTSGNPCSESYAGEQAFAAIEAQRLAEWAKNETTEHNVEFVGFLDLHSYSQEILYPWSFSCDATPPGLENLQELAFGLVKAIRIANGHTYEVMPACEGNVATSASGKQQRLWPRMEAAGGSALDWFYHELRVKYAYQIKLRDRGTYGFLLPKEHIVPTGREILDALLYFGGFLAEVYEQEEEEEEVAPVEGLRDVEDAAERPGSAGGDEEGDLLPVEDIEWELRRRRRR